jgi:copper transport protein
MWISIPTLLIHVTVVGFWVGSLLPLLVALDAPAADAARLFRRFSEIALVVVPQLVVAGAILAVLQVQRPAALIETSYGLTLTVKIAVVAAMLGLAALNRWVLTPRLAGASAGARAGLRVSVGVELAAGIAVLGLTAALSQAVPPRSLALNEELRAAAAQAGRSDVVTARGHSAFFSVTPGRPGWNRVRVRVLGPDAQPLEPIEVTVELSLSGAGMEPLTRKLAAVGDGYFEHAGPELATAGAWRLRIDALITDFDKVSFETRIEVR